MNFIKKLFSSPNFWPLLIVVVFAVLAARSLIFEKGYFTMHDDLQMMRQLEMEKCFFDGQIPCRWVPDMGYGYGFPLFNFYPPLPYLVGQVFRVFQFSFVDTAKLTFALSFIFSGVTMYYLAKEFFGKWGGVVSAVFYIWAPYHSVDVYVRGAMNEAWALVWFPLILWTAYRLINERKRIAAWVIALGLSWTGLLLSHNLMVMIFTPVFAFWCLIFWLKEKNIKKILQLAASGVSALALSAFFTIPAVLEQKYVHVDTLTQGYYEYIAHFATIGQLLTSRYWGYGPSIWGPNDGMPFPVGHIHWILSILLLAVASLLVIRKKIKKTGSGAFYVIFFSAAFAWFASFMAHQNSTFIWQQIKPLAFTQFPWRFLTLATLGFSVIAGSVFVLLPRKLAAAAGALLIIVVVLFNWNYFLPLGGKMGPLTDEEKFKDAAWDLQRTAGIFDYLPATAEQNPKDPPRSLADIIKGKGTVSESRTGTNWATFNINLESDSLVRVNIFKFPVWKTFVDGQSLENFIPDDEVYGRMHINIPSGNHKIELKLENTPVRTVSNYISGAAWLLLATLALRKKKLSSS